MSTRIGSSEKYLKIDLTSTVPPFTFQAAFTAAYPDSGRREFSSRSIVALDGPGTLTLIDAEGAHVAWDMAAYEVNDIVATGIHATDGGVTLIKVML